MRYKFILASFLFLCTVGITFVIVFPHTGLEVPKAISQFRHYHNFLYNDKNLLDSTNLNYVINTDCSTSFLVWIVTSYAGDTSARSALRRAYTNEELHKLGVRRIFLLGKLDEISEHKTRVSHNALLDESKRFNDILQGNFVEDYKNLTYKHLMGLIWAKSACKYAKYIMKMDDDIVVNLYEIINMVKNGAIKNNAIMGYVLKNMIPIRERVNKWYISNEEFPQNVYPTFLSGWLYITALETIKKLTDRNKYYKKYFWIDDVFLTGIIRANVRIETQSINHVYAMDYRYIDCCIEGKKKLLKCEFLIGPNGGDVELQVRFRNFAKFCYTNCVPRQNETLVSNTCVAEYNIKNIGKGSAQVNEIPVL